MLDSSNSCREKFSGADSLKYFSSWLILDAPERPLVGKSILAICLYLIVLQRINGLYKKQMITRFFCSSAYRYNIILKTVISKCWNIKWVCLYCLILFANYLQTSSCVMKLSQYIRI